MSVMLDPQIDVSNTHPEAVKRLQDGQLPPLPVITGLEWQPPAQAPAVQQGGPVTPNPRLMMWANSDKHEWTDWCPDTPGAPKPGGGTTLVDFWNDFKPPAYTLNMFEYWQYIPNTFVQVGPGGGFEIEVTDTSGISQTDENNLSGEFGVSIEGFSASMKAEFNTSVTTSSSNTVTTKRTVGSPADGYTRVWVMFQLIAELKILTADGVDLATAVGTQHGDVNWADHAEGGAFLTYQDTDQVFPSTLSVAVQKDFPSS